MWVLHLIGMYNCVYIGKPLHVIDHSQALLHIYKFLYIYIQRGRNKKKPKHPQHLSIHIEPQTRSKKGKSFRPCSLSFSLYSISLLIFAIYNLGPNEAIFAGLCFASVYSVLWSSRYTKSTSLSHTRARAHAHIYIYLIKLLLGLVFIRP